MDFRPIKRQSAAEQVASSIRDAIVGGDLSVGDALPSERDLAVQFQVNRSTVREALKRLDAWGLIEVRQGGKTLVADTLSSAGMHLLPFLLAPGGRLDQVMVRDLLELRVVLLGFTARLAATRGTPQQREQLLGLVDRLSVAGTAAERQALDWAFYQAMVDAGDNRVLRILSGVMGRVYSQNQAFFEALYHPTLFGTSHHRLFLDAAERGDGAAALAAMESYGRSAMGAAREG